MTSPASKKDIQRFCLDGEAEGAFQEVKQLLKTLPTLTALIEGETLILYLAVSKEAISSILIAERNGVQMPIYFVSEVLQLSEINYPPIHRMVYALVHTARCLQRYFQGHPILVLTDQPLKQVLQRPESSGRLAKWAIELGEYKINFAQRNAVKGQILADFLLETNEKVEYDTKMAPQQHVWELHTDGASSEEGTGAGLVLTSQDGEEYTYALKLCFYASNNEAEYEALLSGLCIAVEMGITNLRAYVDYQIVAQQVNGMFDASDTSMRQYVKLIEAISKKFDNLEVAQIARNKNKKADFLSKLATLTFDHLHKRVLVEELKEKSIHEKPIVAIVENAKETWMTPYLRYLHDGGRPIDKTEARRIKVTVPIYEVVNEWVEAKALAKITGENVKKFVWHDIVCRYGVPNEIVSDNGKQFVENPFRSWCEELGIKQNFTFVAQPQANGQVEVTNKEIVAGIKTHLGLSKTG
ncbi:uncharacterized protein [Rutidosis leptorrhynchoides]|uniref:uncharacterized protein n=1 Tax=Rutidosis leptorrhynchoides TaxID=125765 RepID=UPI003A9914F1